MDNNCGHKDKACVFHVPIFAGLSEHELLGLEALLITEMYAKGSIICYEGEDSDQIYVIQQGRVKLFTMTEDGREQIFRILEETDFFGELSIFQTEKLSFSVEALTDVRLCTIKQKDMHQLIKTQPSIALDILRTMTNRLQRAEGMIRDLGLRSAEARTASLLVNLCQEQGGDELALSLSRRDLANIIGTTQETLSRNLSRFQDLGWIKLEGHRKIRILDHEALRDMV